MPVSCIIRLFSYRGFRASLCSFHSLPTDLPYSAVTGESAGLANAGFVDPMHALHDLTQYHDWAAVGDERSHDLSPRLRRATLLPDPTFSAQPWAAQLTSGAGPSCFSAVAAPPVPDEESSDDSEGQSAGAVGSRAGRVWLSFRLA